MILRYEYLNHHTNVFLKMTGLRINEFDTLVDDLLSKWVDAQHQRLSRPDRQRDIGGGRNSALDGRDQVLLTVVWLRVYPTHEVLGYLFGVSDSTVCRIIQRVLPLLEQAGRDTMRMPDPRRKRRRSLAELLQDTPDLAVIIDSFEQKVQRPKNPEARDGFYSGKKKTHTLKNQVAVDEQTGAIVEISDSVPDPTADINLLDQSGLMKRLSAGVGGIGDLAYIGLDKLHPHGLGASPRRKPRGKPRPPEDVAYNTAFSRRRILVEHTIGRLRHFQSLSQTDRQHRQHHSARVCAVAGLVNRQLAHRMPA
jgi:DDE superfamily endonuclease/Helix-turn-helix of DDE superfamily endonuclease